MLVVILFLGMIGMSCFIFAIKSLIVSVQLKLNYVKVVGRVIDVQISSSKREGRLYLPKIEYRINNIKHLYVPKLGFLLVTFQKNQEVELLVSSTNPTVARINIFSDLWSGALMLLVLGLACSWWMVTLLHNF